MAPMARRNSRPAPRLSALLAVAAAALLAAGTCLRAAAFLAAPTGASRTAPSQRSLRTPRTAQASEGGEKQEEENPLNKIKELGIAGTISYAIWESAFWIIGGGGALAAYVFAKGHLPDFSDQSEMASVGGGAFVFINGARLIVPVRIGLAVSTTPWVDENIVKKFIMKDETSASEAGETEASEPVAQKEKEKEKVAA